MYKDYNFCLCFLELFPFDYFHNKFLVRSITKTVRDISMKLGSFIKHNETMCHAEEL